MDFFTKIFSTQSKNDKIENFIAGEDFLRILCSYPSIRDSVFNGEFSICCPSSSSMVGSSLSKSAVMNHILAPSTQPGDFKTMNGKLCSIVGHYIVLGEGFPYSRRIRIMNTSVRNLDGGQSITVYHTNQPFVGGLKSPEDYDEISSVLVNKYIAAIVTFPCMEGVINEMDDFIQDMNQLAKLTKHEGYNQLQPSVRHCLIAKWKYFSQLIYSRLPSLHDSHSHRHDQQQQPSTLSHEKASLSMRQIEQIVESYLFKGLGQNLWQWLHMREAHRQEQFIQSIECLAEITQQDLEIAEFFQTDQTEAIQLLLTMPQRTITPTDKLLFMKEVVLAIQETIDRNLQELRNLLEKEDCSVERDLALEKLDEADFATDDLIPILIWVLLQAFRREPDIFVDFLFARQFHFVQASTSPIAFTTCHYDVALQWLSQPTNFPLVQSPASSLG